MKWFAIYGAGPHGRVAFQILSASGHFHQFLSKFEAIAFLDDDPDLHGDNVIDGYGVMGGWDQIEHVVSAFVAIGDNEARCRIAEKLEAAGLELVNAVHPSAVVMSGAELGRGVFVAPGAVIMTGAVVNDLAVVNTGATVDHDCVLERGAYLSPGVHLAGCASVGERAFVGVGASIGPDVWIGEGAMVGAGAAVLGNVAPWTLAAGVPAEFVKKLRKV